EDEGDEHRPPVRRRAGEGGLLEPLEIVVLLRSLNAGGRCRQLRGRCGELALTDGGLGARAAPLPIGERGRGRGGGDRSDDGGGPSASSSCSATGPAEKVCVAGSPGAP